MPSYLGLITPPDVSAIIELMRSIRDVPHEPVVPRRPDEVGPGAGAPTRSLQ
jgi:cytochrome c oxidase subunit 2